MYINAKGCCCRQRSDNGQVKTAKGQCCREGGARRGQCNQMAQNLQKLHKHTHAHTARKDTCGTCSNSSNGSNLQRTRKSLPGGSQAVPGSAVWQSAVCVDFSLLRPSTVASSKPTAAAAAAAWSAGGAGGSGGGTGGDSANSFYCCSCCCPSPAAAALLLLLLLLYSCYACSCIPSPAVAAAAPSPALVLAMALRFCRVRFAALTVHQCGPGGQLAAMVLRLPQTPVAPTQL